MSKSPLGNLQSSLKKPSLKGGGQGREEKWGRQSSVLLLETNSDDTPNFNLIFHLYLSFSQNQGQIFLDVIELFLTLTRLLSKTDIILWKLPSCYLRKGIHWPMKTQHGEWIFYNLCLLQYCPILKQYMGGSLKSEWQDISSEEGTAEPPNSWKEFLCLFQQLTYQMAASVLKQKEFLHMTSCIPKRFSVE